MYSSPPIYSIVFTAVIAAAVLLQALVLLGIYFAIRKSTAKLHEVMDEVKGKALPAIESAKDLLDDISPKLKVATGNLTEVSHTLRKQADHVDATMELLLDKTNIQINRVNEMADATFDALNQASKAIEMAVELPARRVSNVLHGLRVGMDVFFGKKRPLTERETIAEAPEPTPVVVPVEAESKPEAESRPEAEPEPVEEPKHAQA